MSNYVNKDYISSSKLNLSNFTHFPQYDNRSVQKIFLEFHVFPIFYMSVSLFSIQRSILDNFADFSTFSAVSATKFSKKSDRTDNLKQERK